MTPAPLALLSAAGCALLLFASLACGGANDGSESDTHAIDSGAARNSSASKMPSVPQPTRWTADLPRAATTSAGVYNARGQLIRTLWRAEAMPAGTLQGSWDGRDDNGQLAASGNYEIRLLHHHLNYVWEGVVGNSSGAFGGEQVHKAFLPPTSLTIVGDQAHYAVGYNEGQPGLHGFALAAPQFHLKTFDSTDPFIAYAMVTSDDKRLYAANIGGLVRTSFIGAFDLASPKRVTFQAGTSVCLNTGANSNQCYPDQTYASVVDLQTDATQTPTGLAVQRLGPLLAVAHGKQNLIRLFDKTSGALVRQMSVALAPNALNQLAMTPAGDLWVVSGNAVVRYVDLGGVPKVASRIDGLDHPLALAASPSTDEGVWVADGGASQQLKHFDREGRAGVVIGQRGGYNNDPLVAPDKLCFKSPAGREQAAIGVVSERELWVVDDCNNRMLKFRADGNRWAYNGAQVAYLPAFYTSTVDHGNPRRVFANFLEFDVDTLNPLVPGQSWKLVRNWLAGLPASLIDDRAINGGFGGFTSVETLANGRTYGIVSAQGRQVLVELPASGPLRVVKVFAPPFPQTTSRVLYENGDLGYALTGPKIQSVMRLPLSGFDGANDPVWPTEPTLLATVPTLPGSPYYRNAFSGMPPRFPVTASGKVIFFDQSVVGNEGFHLGAAVSGTAEWLWQASPSGALDGKGSFQTKAIDGSITYGGNAVWASGRHIVYGYHGEFYKDMQNGRVGQANQFMHFDDSGLFLGEFGQSSTRPSTASQAGLSGNTFSPTLVRDGSHLYLYHNDEWAHGGVHRWRIDGWDDLVDMKGAGAMGSTIVLR